MEIIECPWFLSVESVGLCSVSKVRVFHTAYLFYVFFVSRG